MFSILLHGRTAMPNVEIKSNLQFEQKHCVAKAIVCKCHWHAFIS